LCARTHKYVLSIDTAIDEALFDLEANPGETANLAGDASRAELLTACRSDLAAWMRETDDPLLKRPDVASLLAADSRPSAPS
jgi:hypothetical protein